MSKELNIIICIKQVPNTTEVQIDSETGTLIREGVESIINPFDMYAIEEGLRLKERFGGKTTIMSMGPPQVESALLEAISMGIDDAVMLSDRAFAGSDTLATSYALAQTIRKIGSYDIIICGKQASDGDTAQVGPGIAVHLDIPQITYVRKIEDVNNEFIRAERLMEEGYDVIESSLPVLLTVVKEINEPRLPSLKGKLRAKKYEIQKITSKEIDVDETKLGLDGSPTQVMRVFAPPKRSGGEILHGDADELSQKLTDELKKLS